MQYHVLVYLSIEILVSIVIFGVTSCEIVFALIPAFHVSGEISNIFCQDCNRPRRQTEGSCNLYKSRNCLCKENLNYPCIYITACKSSTYFFSLSISSSRICEIFFCFAKFTFSPFVSKFSIERDGFWLKRN